MFEAKVYKVCIVSSGIALAEEHYAKVVIECWNQENAEEKQIVFIPVQISSTSEADMYVFPIDNYVDVSKVEAAIKTSSPVLLFFRKSHNPDNTISSELDAVKKLRAELSGRCTCIDYNEHKEFQDTFFEILQSQMLYK